MSTPKSLVIRADVCKSEEPARTVNVTVEKESKAPRRVCVDLTIPKESTSNVTAVLLTEADGKQRYYAATEYLASRTGKR
jgi:hypothetical protein